MGGSNTGLRVLLREGVEFRCFPASTVAYHPDTGDTLVLDVLCGRILQLVAESGGVLGYDAIADRVAGDTPAGMDQLRSYLDELEFRDLVRMIGPA